MEGSVEAHSPILISTPLLGSISKEAYYFLTVFVGVPPQKQSVILDTGSSLFVFPCADCDTCGEHLDPGYDVSRSRVSEWLKCDDKLCFGNSCSTDGICQYSQSYSEGSSISGKYFSDIVSLTAYVNDLYSETNSAAQLSSRFNHIGCHQRETKLFTTQVANGIMGVSFPRKNSQPSVLDGLFHNSVFKSEVSNKVMSMCLGDEGGVFTVGGIDRAYITPVKVKEGVKAITEGNSDGFSPTVSFGQSPRFGSTMRIVSNTTYDIGKGLRVRGYIRLGDSEFRQLDQLNPAREYESIDLLGTLGESTIVDSGTTFTYLTPDVYQSVNALISGVCKNYRNCSSAGSSLSDICVELPHELNAEDAVEVLDANFPHLEIAPNKIGIQGLPWLPRSYFYKHEGSAAKWCIGIDDNRTDSTVLGMTFFKNAMVGINRQSPSVQVVGALKCPDYKLSDRMSVISEPSFKSTDQLNLPAAVETPTVHVVAELSTDDSRFDMLVGAAILLSLGLLALALRTLYLRYNSRHSAIDAVIGNAGGSVELERINMSREVTLLEGEEDSPSTAV